jgi:hypothetical protein
LGPLALGQGLQDRGQQDRGLDRGQLDVDHAGDHGGGDGEGLMLAAGAGQGDLGRVGGQAGQDGGQVGGGVVGPAAGGSGRAAGGQLVEGPLGVRGVQLLFGDVQQRAAVQHGGADVAAVALQVRASAGQR